MKSKLLPLLCLFGLFLSVLGATVQDVKLPGIQNRIVSGSPAALGQFPWQVILKKDPVDDLLCGGSIVASTWVLTAAHCTYGLSSIFLVFGTIQLDNPSALNMTSNQLYIHPDYNNANLNNDVSLIQLPSALSFSTIIAPITIVPASYVGTSFLGSVAIIAGFGLTDDEYLDFSQTLLYARVDIINNSQCVSVFGTEVVIASTICAKGNGGSNMSICSGDSGGPLITQDTNGNFIQIGINSFVAEDMCTEGYPSGYARLTSYLDYITDTTGIAFNSS